MGNFTNFFKAGLLAALISFAFQGVDAQTVDCMSTSGCTITANPPAGNPGDVVSYVLVDEDGNIVTSSSDGTFENVTPGTYTVYSVSYPSDSAADFATIVTGGNQGDLDTFISDAAVSAEVSDPIGVTSPACNDFEVVHSAICSPDKSEFQVLLVFQGGEAGTGGYVITDDQSGASFGPLSANSITFGPFDSGSAYSYTVSVADNPECAVSVSQSVVDCQTTEVELARFSAEAAEGGNLLSWTTATETNAKYFIVEHSTNGSDFQQVGTKFAAGNSSVNQDYTFLHSELANGTHYYRLKEVDVEGNVRIFTRTITVIRSAEDFAITEVYPVPTVDVINVQFITNNDEPLTVQVVDVTGKVVGTQNFKANAGVNQITLDVAPYAAGNYFVSISNGTNTIVEKFVKN